MSIIEKFLDLDKKPTVAKDETSKEVMTKSESKKEKHFVRTLGDVRPAAEAQRIFNPNLPPMAPKAPTAAQMESGTTSAAGMEGNWGTSGRQEK
jgi:hypothetical protein